MSLILSFIALILFFIVGIIYNIFALFYDVKGRKWYKTTDKRNFKKSLNLDVFGNYQYGDFWNFLFSKGGYGFGRFGETMSSVFGKKQVEKSLPIAGWVMLVIINILFVSDWWNGIKGKGFHCTSSIKTDEEINQFIKQLTHPTTHD